MHKIFSLLLATAALLAPLCPAAGAVPARTDYSELNKGSAEQKYRHRTFRAYLPNAEINRRYKIGNYSSYENPTGIFFSAGEQATITLSGAPDQKITLIVNDFEQGGARDEYPLSQGVNHLTIRHKGLGYLDYRSTDPEKAPAVHADIAGGQINGVFTRHDSAATWKRLLAHAKCNILDLLGQRCQLTYDVEGLRKGCPERGPELLKTYDRIIALEQDDILGWKREGIHPGNHIHGRVQWGGFMHADHWGAAFHFHTIPGLSSIERLHQGAWGVAHEFGHVNQTRRGMKWVGTAEVTNNIFSAWVNYNLCPSVMRLEHERIQNADNKSMIGGRFDCYINHALVDRRLWQYHGGPDDGNTTPPAHSTGDHFVSVCPLWQLQLYCAVARGKSGFYPSIFHSVRNTDETQLTEGQLRVLFFRRACDAAKLDLSAFFVKTGMLAPMDRLVRDYSNHHMTITRSMCEEAIRYASRYPKPDSSVIFYITANSVDIFAGRKNVRQPSANFSPVLKDGIIEVPANCWENAVAFEAYAGDKLLRVSLRGLNHQDHQSTSVICPEGTTSVKAVQWDGRRFLLAAFPEK